MIKDYVRFSRLISTHVQLNSTGNESAVVEIDIAPAGPSRLEGVFGDAHLVALERQYFST